MKKVLSSALLILVFSAPAYAQNQAAFCKLWFTHKNVEPAAYEAGVDVKGKPVAPADLNDQSAIFSGDAIRIPLTIDLAEQLEGKLPSGTEMKTGISMISISRNGTVKLNDQDISDSAYEVCTGEKPPMKKADTEVKKDPQVQPAEVPLVKAPQKPSAPDAPVLMKTERAGEERQDDIIWGKGY